jgi:hypothetical protein
MDGVDTGQLACNVDTLLFCSRSRNKGMPYQSSRESILHTDRKIIYEYVSIIGLPEPPPPRTTPVSCLVFVRSLMQFQIGVLPVLY